MILSTPTAAFTAKALAVGGTVLAGTNAVASGMEGDWQGAGANAVYGIAGLSAMRSMMGTGARRLQPCPTLRIASGGGEQWAGQAPLNERVQALQVRLLAGERVLIPRAERWTLAELGNASSGLQREVLITGEGTARYIQLSGARGGQHVLGATERVIAHTHPGEGYWGLQRTALGTDVTQLGALGQSRAAVVNESGAWRSYSASGDVGEVRGVR